MMHEDIMKRCALAAGVDQTIAREPWPPRSILYADADEDLDMDERPFCPEFHEGEYR